MTGEKATRRSSFGNMMRRRLSDITNSIPQPKSPSIPDKLAHDAPSAKEFIDHLVKEKMTLVKLIQDKNKIIEMSGIEIQSLRNCLQKMQLQNWSLAQANSQMLAELNLGKERIKALQHEVMCKEALLKAKNLQPAEQKEVVNVRKSEFQEPNMNTVKESEINEDTSSCKASRRRRSTRSQSLGSSTVSHPHVEKDAAESKRRCLRRQSARSRIAHEEPADNMFEIDEAKFLLAVPSNSPASEASGGEARKSYGGRPLRRAAEKIQSYKERPINVKMRRSE